MDYPYTINDIKAATQVSLQSLYTLIKKNKAFINDNSIRKQRKIYYSQAAMDFFISYYNSEHTPETPPEAEEQAANVPSAEYRIDAMKAQIDALHAEISTLHKQLDAKETERLELLRQNGALILTLQQEKQEKMLLLPPPKKSLSDRFRTFLGSRSHQE